METDAKQDVREIDARPADVTDLATTVDAFFDNPKADAIAMNQREARRKALLKTCFVMTSASQWTIFRDEKTGKATVYPQGGAGDAILRHVLGCLWQDKEVEVTLNGDGQPESAKASGWLCTSAGRRIERFEGFREMGGYVKNRSDLIKCALENMKSVAVRDVLGLRGRSPEELSALGLDLSKVGVATFANNKSGDVVTFPPFGKKSGVAIDDPSVTLKDIEWYAGRAKETLADPQKAKYHKSEQKRLDAYTAEYKRRQDAAKAPPSSAASSATPKAEPQGEDYSPEDRAAAQSALFPEPNNGRPAT